MDKMFEQASRMRLRFVTSKGQISVEDLWALPLQSSTGRPNLDDIAKELYLSLKSETEVVSFVDDTVKANKVEALSFELVKYVIGVKKEENKLAVDAAQKAAQRQKIMELIAQKQDTALSAKSEEELQELLKTL